MAKSEETRMQFIELRAQGKSYKQICSSLNIAKSTAVDWGRELEHEIARLKAVELEAHRSAERGAGAGGRRGRAAGQDQRGGAQGGEEQATRCFHGMIKVTQGGTSGSNGKIVQTDQPLR